MRYCEEDKMTVLPFPSAPLEDTTTDDDPDVAARQAYLASAHAAQAAWHDMEERFLKLLRCACPHLTMQAPSYRLTRPEVSSLLTVLQNIHPEARIMGTPTIGELLGMYAQMHDIQPRSRHHLPLL